MNIRVAENLTGSLPIFQRAFERLTGLDGSQLLDYVATGKLLAKDILPLFAEELQKAANASGALDAKLQTTMTQQGRFFKQLETAQDTIFRGGMDKGGAAMFNQLAKGLDESEHGLKSFGKLFEAVFKTVAGIAKVLMPILSDLATMVGTLAQGLMTIFGSTTGRIFVGMIAFNRVIGMLNTSTGRLALNWAAVLGTITEVIALFTRGYVGVTELALGGDLALGELEIFQKLGDMFNDDGLMGDALRSIVTYLPLILVAIAAVRTAILASRGIRGIFGRIGKGGSKAARTSTKTTTKTGTTKTTPTGKETRRYGHGGSKPNSTPRSNILSKGKGLIDKIVKATPTKGKLLFHGGARAALGPAGWALLAAETVHSIMEALDWDISQDQYSSAQRMQRYSENQWANSLNSLKVPQSTIIEKQENHITVPAGTTSEQVQYLRDEWDRIMMNNAVQ